MRAVLSRAGALLLCAVAATDCGSTSTSSITAPSSSKCQVTVSGGSTSFPAEGGNGGFTVSTTRDCSWSAQSTVSWIHLDSNASGQGEANVSFSVDQNSAQAGRSGQIIVSAQSLSVTQAAAPRPPAPKPSPVPAPGPSPAPTPTPNPAPPPNGTGVTVHIDGKVSDVTGSCPFLRFSLGSATVITNGGTDFRKMKCGDIENGSKVKVTGEVQRDGTVLASRVERD